MKQALRIWIFIILILTACFAASAQDVPNQSIGQVSFISSQHVYVKFKNTVGITKGDTLFVDKNSTLIPALIVTDLSSISCVTKALHGMTFEVNAPITAKIQKHEPVPEVQIQKATESVAVVTEVIEQVSKRERNKKTEAPVSGRISVSSYTNQTNNFSSYQRFRYNVSLRADSIAKTGLSAETNLTFTHKLNESIFLSDALRVYGLSLKYNTKSLGSLVVGRKINPQLANIGAIDGIQYEKNIRKFSVGAVAGFRPDLYSYGFNPTLFQFGAFAAHNFNKGQAQTSIAVMNQTNNMITDRRFAYIQHNNSLIKRVNLFCSFEVDLYSLQNNQPTTVLDLTGAYLSLRYKPLKNLAFTLSYDARKNIYYYETYKNVADSILDKETRQGLRFQTTYRPFENITWGLTGGARFPGTNTVASTNANTFLSYDNVPFVGGTVRADFTALKTYNLNGLIYGGAYSKDFLKNKLYTELGYRYVNYTYTNSASLLNQNIAELSVNWRITKKLMLSADVESIFDNENNFSTRLFINVSQRF